MSAPSEELQYRKQLLMTRSSLERLEIVAALHEVQDHFSLVNDVTGLIRAIRHYPVIAGLLTAGVASAKWQGVGGWVQRAWAIWTLARKSQSWAKSAWATFRRR